MPLGLVYIQEQTHLFIKPRIDPRKPLCQILMYCGFTDPEALGGGADGGPVVYDEHRQVTGALLDICVHMHHSPCFRI